MRRFLISAGALALLAATFMIARADVNYTQGSGTVIFDFLCFTTKHCTSHVPINSAGTEIMTSANPGQVGAPAAAMADGWDATQGAKADAAWTSGSGSLIAIAKTIAGNTAAAVPAGTARIGYVSDDPCSQLTKKGAPFSLTASGQVITGTASNKTYICSIDLMSATAQNIALVEGTGSVCATNIFGLAGGTTAATGWNLAANGGLTKGAGVGTVYSPSADVNALAANVCLLLSSTGQTSGQITYVTAP